MNFGVVAATFPLVALGELPDKTMFASLLLAARGRPLAVWLGAAAAFSVHVVIAVSIGVALIALLPHRLLEVLVAVAFLGAGAYSWWSRDGEDETIDAAPARSGARTFLTAASVIFLAEWGDLTQIITADLAARTHHPLSVGVGALAAVLCVAAVAVVGGASILQRLSVRTLRTVTAVVLVALGLATLVGATA